MRHLSITATSSTLLLLTLFLISSPSEVVFVASHSFCIKSPCFFRIHRHSTSKSVHNASFCVGKYVHKRIRHPSNRRNDQGDEFSETAASTTTSTASKLGEESSSNDSLPVPPKRSFSIREARFKDLSRVSNIIVESFYKPSLFKRYHAMAELNRLQSNFPYGDDKHFMYVAYANKNGSSADSNGRSSDESSIVGFCDIDARPLKGTWQQNATYNPRPYLSDLAVDIRWRRRGIARALIRACEEKAFRLGFDYLYLRVKFDNEPAILMYAEMGYDILMDDEATDDTILLRKQVKSS
jgi:ribosomal protein S18 acetylase RimI-like enzyme